MHESLFIPMGLIFVLGLAAQWLSWKFRIPSIVLLLGTGFLIGPVTGFLNPDKLLGDLLFPIVSLSVAIILFEGGMNLKTRELKDVGKTVLRLVSIGVMISFALGTLGALYILGISLKVSLIIGAILVVSGPTVILPILQQMHPRKSVNSLMKWEGIVNDPVGAILTILIFEAVLAVNMNNAFTVVLAGLGKTLIVSVPAGIFCGYLITRLIHKKIIPNFLQNPLTLTFVIVVYIFSNSFQQESGLIGVTIMGIYLANQQKVSISGIVEFKENLRILLISFLFIILAARLEITDFLQLDYRIFLFIVFLVIIVRPTTVFLSTFGSGLDVREKLLLSWMNPRGIVAAAVASLLSIGLIKAGIEQAALLQPIVFMIIVASIAIYGLSANPVARMLKLADPSPQGCLFIGANEISLSLASILKEHKFETLIVDTNRRNIHQARDAGLKTYHGSILSEYINDELDLYGMGRLLAMTANEEVNSLSTMHFSNIFGGEEVYQLPMARELERGGTDISIDLKAQILFGENTTYLNLLKLLQEGGFVKATKITAEFSLDDYYREYGGRDRIIPLCIIDSNHKISFFTTNVMPEITKGVTVVSLITV